MITNTRCVHCGRESYSKTSPRACANCGQNFDVPSRPGGPRHWIGYNASGLLKPWHAVDVWHWAPNADSHEEEGRALCGVKIGGSPPVIPYTPPSGICPTCRASLMERTLAGNAIGIKVNDRVVDTQADILGVVESINKNEIEVHFPSTCGEFPETRRYPRDTSVLRLLPASELPLEVAVQEVTEYLQTLARMRGLDPELIHGVNGKILRVSALRRLLTALQ